MVKSPVFRVVIFNLEGLAICFNISHFDGYDFSQISEVEYVDFCIDKLSFKQSKYVCSIGFSENESKNILDFHEKCYGFDVTGNSLSQGLINPFPKWSLKCNKGRR